MKVPGHTTHRSGQVEVRTTSGRTWNKQQFCTIGGGRQMGEAEQREEVQKVLQLSGVNKRRRARYVRRAERTGMGTVRGREEFAVAALATVGVSGQRVDNEQ